MTMDRKRQARTDQCSDRGALDVAARPLIELHDLVKTYSSAAGDSMALKGIDADIHGGEFVAVIGKSGSGKSTLINMITGIDRPTSGQVLVSGKPIHEMSENQLAAWRGKMIGIVFQFFQLLPMLSLCENIMLPMDFCNMYTRRERKERALALLDMVEMADHADKLPSEVSGGEQQRVAIARALANDPPILAADEPTGNLDSKTAEVVFGIFEDLVAEGKTILMVTHDASQAKRVTRTLLIADGEIVNEYVAQALPSLTPEQMLIATRQLEPLRYESGATILQQGGTADRLYIVTRGRAEVALSAPGAQDVIVSRPVVGEYFGEIELLRGGENRASVRASEIGVEVVAIERAGFMRLLEGSDATRDAVAKIADERLAENIAHRQETGQ